MKENFVNYEIALKLKELGFDEECIAAYYEYIKDEITLAFESGQYGWVKQNDTMLMKCTAPLWQQAQKWLREKHKIYIELVIDGWGDDSFCVSEENLCYRAFIWQVGKPKPEPWHDLGASSYEKILEVAILESLKLIKDK